MSKSRRDPDSDLGSPQEAIARSFGGPFPRPFGRAETLTPAIPLDIVEDGDTLRITASVPGFAPDGLRVTLDGDLLRIYGEAHAEKELNEDYYLRERRYDRAERSIRLPFQVDAEAATAEYDKGVLTCSLPRSRNVRHNEIKVQAKPAEASDHAE